jgi:hypothetical protein
MLEFTEHVLANKFVGPYQMIPNGSMYENNSHCVLEMTH